MKKLIITEKPSVASNICDALGIKDRSTHKGYIEDDNYVVSWCFGHLIELAEPSVYGEQYRKWSYETLPVLPDTWRYEIKEDTREQFEVLKTLLNREDTEPVEATDCGREGEAIFRLVYQMAACKKPFYRLWISSMEGDAIRDGFRNLKPGTDYDNLYASAICRQEADWLVGINGTRLFSTLYGKTLKVGRVQSPTLAALVSRDSEIKSFKKEPFYTVHIIKDKLDGASDPVKDKDTAEKLALSCKGKAATIVSVTEEEKTIAAPALYDLTSLQRDANRIFGYTAKQTLEYTQSLYEKKLLTYPRTDSRFLSDDMEETARRVLSTVRSAFSFIGEGGLDNYGKILNSKKVTDHHAIIPTMETGSADLNTIPNTERNILALVAVRLACAVGEPHKYTASKVVLSCAGEKFTLRGKTVTRKGWKETEEDFRKAFGLEVKEKESILPVLVEGQVFLDVESKSIENFTKPPKAYTEDTLLSSMERAGIDEMSDDVERKGLGTPATRADIIEKLVTDGFVKREKKQLIPTEDGIKLISVLPETLKSAKLTAEWENKLARIAKGETDPDIFISEIKDLVKKLVVENHEVTEEQRAIFGTASREILGKCPRCGSDVVKGKYGPYCTCKTCHMKLGKAMGKELSDEQVKSLLEGKRILVKGIKSKKGKTYDAFLTPKGISDFSYTDKDGQEITGFQFDYHLEFPN
ncbi:MAG: DNA topoisomerase 3 [Lachnospiraceae bacterium]|nr:DNA topoisomerase 3 [Lachnospiraceae bacterium]